MSQKFHSGDLVHVAKDLGEWMRHFTADIDAIVIGSYHDLYGGGNSDEPDYSLYLEGQGECSWYNESQLTLIEPAAHDLLRQWREVAEDVRKQESDLDWIFANGHVLTATEEIKGTVAATLGACLGIADMWGSRGEGLDLWANTISVWNFAFPYLARNDKAGFLSAASEATK